MISYPRKVKKLDLLEFNDGCGISRRPLDSRRELDVTRCYIAGNRRSTFLLDMQTVQAKLKWRRRSHPGLDAVTAVR